MTPGVPALAAPELVLVRYGEIALKRGNRKQFELALIRNLQEAVAGLSPVRVERSVGRITLVPERRGAAVAARAAEVFGVKTVSPAWGAPNDPEAIAEVARALLAETLAERAGPWPVPFRVTVRRANKGFPMNSLEFQRYLGERILPGPERVKVQLDDPELTLGVEVRERRSYLFLKRLPGPGGLPVGTLGRALCLLSGGIDSPVAAWMAMKRGCQLGYASFHSAPWVGEGFKKKVADLARALGRWQRRSALFLVPFGALQTRIRDRAPEAYRTVLYRRAMQVIATRLAAEHHYGALVTGECLGQVASQTLENIACIADATPALVLRPLLGFDKEEVIAIARRIGTFDLSNVPEPDCCTLFQPSRPMLRGRIEDCRAAERAAELGELIDRAVGESELRVIEAE